MEGQLRGTVRLVFQPAEEGGAGARKMLDAVGGCTSSIQLTQPIA
jgi:metal-dependent amidase/aminoacylase/carboxypeptidase family protein